MKTIVILALLLALIPANYARPQLPGDFNCNGVINVVDLAVLNEIMGFVHGLVDTDSCTWENGDLNGDGLYHTVADWIQFLYMYPGDTLPENPPQPETLFAVMVSDGMGAPGDSVVVPLFIRTVEELSGMIIQIQFHSQYLLSPRVSQGPHSFNLNRYFENDAGFIGVYFSPWQGPEPGTYHIANLHFTIAENAPADTDFTIALIAGDYYPSGFSNMSTPTYFIGPVLVNGTIHVRSTGIDDAHTPDEMTFGLTNFPNPFNSSTTIQFFLNEQSPVQLVIYDILGRQIDRPIESFLSAGQHEIIWDAGDRPSGVYFYLLRVGHDAATGRMTLLR